MWRTSTYSTSQGGNCVEVGKDVRSVLVRDTKQAHLGDAARTVVPFSARAWADFTAGLRK